MKNQMPKIIAIANQKGGVGKTTTAINLGAALADKGYRALVVDIDPQGNASTGLGFGPDQRKLTTYDVIIGESPLRDVIVETNTPGLFLAPSTVDLSSSDVDLVANEKRIFLLHTALREPTLDQFGFDVVLIDCPPSLNLLTINAMVGAHSVFIPLQSEFFALEGLAQLMHTIREIRQAANPNLRIEGVLLTMYDTRNNLCRQVEEDARENLDNLLFETKVPRNIRLSEAPSFAMPVTQYDPQSTGAVAYRSVATELLRRMGWSKEEMAGV